MSKIRNAFITFLLIYSVTWYAIGIYGKQVISKQINNFEIFKFKKISLGGYPFSFKYTVDDLTVFDEKSENKDFSINKSLIKVDLLNQNFIFEPLSPISFQSHDNKINYSAKLGNDSSLTISTSRPFFVRYFNDNSTKIQKYAEKYTLKINNLDLIDQNIDKILLTIPKLNFSNQIFASKNKLLNEIKLDFLENGGDELGLLDSGEAKINADLIIVYDKEYNLKLLKILDLNFLAPSFGIRAIGTIDADQPSTHMNSIKVVFNESIDPNNNKSPDHKMEYVVKNIFLDSLNDPKNNEMPITINITKAGDTINFGKNDIFGLSFLVHFFSEKYNQEFLKKDQEVIENSTHEMDTSDEESKSTENENNNYVTEEPTENKIEQNLIHHSSYDQPENDEEDEEEDSSSSPEFEDDEPTNESDFVYKEETSTPQNLDNKV